MNSKVATKRPKLTKYQVYLTQNLQERFTGYINKQFSSEDRVVTAVIRKAVDEYLSNRGF